MTIFGKVLIGLMLATAAVLIIKGAGGKEEIIVTEESTDSASITEEPVVEDDKFNGSMTKLIARGGNHKCTFTQEVENSKSTGTVYISGKKMRGDFVSAVNAGGTPMNVESHMIFDGEFMYSWSSMMPTGFKMKIVETSTTATTATTASQQSFDTNVDLEYTCVAWTPEETQFMLPTGITFKEM